MQVKESRLYLEFFKKNLAVILIPTLIALFISIYLYLNLSPIYKSSVALKYPYSPDKAQDQTLIVDQAVYEIRSKMISSGDIKIYKPSPFSIQIDSYSNELVDSSQNLNISKSYLEQNYKFDVINQPVTLKQPKSLIPSLLVIFSGLSLALLISLVLTYFKKF